jgi:RNA recognition motif-containing protein
MASGDATRAMQGLDGREFGGRPLKVNEEQDRSRFGSGHSRRR